MALQNGFKMPNSEDCASYYVCEFNQMTKIECDEGTLFDPEILVCNWAGMVECGETPILRSTMIPEAVTTRPAPIRTTVRTTARPTARPTTAVRTTRAPITKKPQDESSMWSDPQWRPDMQMNGWSNQNQYWFPNGPMVQERPGPFYPPMNPGFHHQFPQFYPDRVPNFNPNYNYPSGMNQNNQENQHNPHYRPTTAAATTDATTTTLRTTTPRATTPRTTTARTTERATTVRTTTARASTRAPYTTKNPGNVIPLEEDLYPKCNDQGLYFLSHPKNCESYFICTNGMLVLHSCATGIHWNEQANQCDFPHKANCFAAKQEPSKGPHLLKPAAPELPGICLAQTF
jgi:hypothetical protein